LSGVAVAKMLSKEIITFTFGIFQTVSTRCQVKACLENCSGMDITEDSLEAASVSSSSLLSSFFTSALF
jgi:hypothetical protein